MQEQQRRVRHENGEGEMERYDTHATNNFFMSVSHACMCTRMNMCERDCAHAMCRKNVCATGECTYILHGARKRYCCSQGPKGRADNT